MTKVLLRSPPMWALDVTLEFKPEDLWIGAYWRRMTTSSASRPWQVDLWVCLLPCLPIHFTWWPGDTGAC